MSECYVVVVRHNLVQSIDRAHDMPESRIAKSPLEVSTELANNYRQNGCIDGQYCFDDSQWVKTFAVLCLEFTRTLAERRLAEIEKLPVGLPVYRAGDESMVAPPADDRAARK